MKPYPLLTEKVAGFQFNSLVIFFKETGLLRELCQLNSHFRDCRKSTI